MAKPDREWIRELWREAARATTLGWELALPIFGGVLLGHFLDRRLETGYSFTVGLLFAGAFAGFYNVWRFNQRLQQKQDARKKSNDRGAAR